MKNLIQELESKMLIALTCIALLFLVHFCATLTWLIHMEKSIHARVEINCSERNFVVDK